MEIKIDQIIFQIINFSILLFVFKKFIYKPVLKVLDNRAARIKEGLEAAEKNISLQQEVEQQKQKLVADAKKEADQIISTAKKEAESLRTQIQQEAKKEAKSALVKERTAFNAQVKKQQAQLKSDLVSLVTEAAEAVLKETVDLKVQKTIVDQQIHKLNSSLLS